MLLSWRHRTHRCFGTFSPGHLFSSSTSRSFSVSSYCAARAHSARSVSLEAKTAKVRKTESNCDVKVYIKRRFMLGKVR